MRLSAIFLVVLVLCSFCLAWKGPTPKTKDQFIKACLEVAAEAEVVMKKVNAKEDIVSNEMDKDQPDMKVVDKIAHKEENYEHILEDLTHKLKHWNCAYHLNGEQA